MSPRLFQVSESDAEEVAREITTRRPDYRGLIQSITPIVADVRRRGDEALLEYTRQFNGADLSSIGLRIRHSEIDAAYREVSPRLRRALEKMAENIKTVARLQLSRLRFSRRLYGGVEIALHAYPLQSVGCYIPGGVAAYPSTALMTTIPAKVAGVKRIAICTPPNNKGEVSKPVLAALKIAGVEEAYRVGGPQAIAALAYGTETIKPVAKIIGPGGGYVTAAKLAVSNDVAIDMPAGPTELVIYSDDEKLAEDVMYELCAQAEHSTDTLVGLVTTDERLATAVLEGMEVFMSRFERREIISKSWSESGFVAICKSREAAVRLINEIAPEHVSIISKNPSRMAEMITSAGLVSLGAHTSTALCDYMVGVNHILPTSGYAKLRGGLGILDYVRLVFRVRASRRSARSLARYVEELALAEGLPGHALAARRVGE